MKADGGGWAVSEALLSSSTIAAMALTPNLQSGQVNDGPGAHQKI